jgi:hypothetical protein
VRLYILTAAIQAFGWSDITALSIVFMVISGVPLKRKFAPKPCRTQAVMRQTTILPKVALLPAGFANAVTLSLDLNLPQMNAK